VQSLRAYGKQPICLISAEDADHHWEKIASKNSNVYYLKGNVLNMQEMYHAGIKEAHLVLILASSA